MRTSNEASVIEALCTMLPIIYMAFGGIVCGLKEADLRLLKDKC
jgi:hypothetical protein